MWPNIENDDLLRTFAHERVEINASRALSRGVVPFLEMPLNGRVNRGSWTPILEHYRPVRSEFQTVVSLPVTHRPEVVAAGVAGE